MAASFSVQFPHLISGDIALVATTGIVDVRTIIWNIYLSQLDSIFVFILGWRHVSNITLSLLASDADRHLQHAF